MSRNSNIIKFVDQDKMSPVQLALESARYLFTQLHGATISYSGNDYTYVFDNTEVQNRINAALSSIGLKQKRTDQQTHS